MEKVYKLNWDTSHLHDSEYDAYHLTFEGDMLIGANMISTRLFEMPSRIFFRGNFNVIPAIDYPITSLTIQILSNKMIEILNSVGHFKYRSIPVSFIDDTHKGLFLDENSRVLPHIRANHDYKAVQLLECTDVFDYEKSHYEEDFLLPVGHISKLVLKEPVTGFPSIFKIEQTLSTVFVSEKSKMNLLNNGIKGCVFEDVEVS